MDSFGKLGIVVHVVRAGNTRRGTRRHRDNSGACRRHRCSRCIVYVLCALTSVLCAGLRIRSYRGNRSRLLLWSTLCFVGLAINNILLFVDNVPDAIDLRLLRSLAGLAALSTLRGADWFQLRSGVLTTLSLTVLEPVLLSWLTLIRTGATESLRCGVGDRRSSQNATSLLNVGRGTSVVPGPPMTPSLVSVPREPELAILSVAPQTHTALTYVQGALFNPVSLSVMAFAVCVGVGYAGMLGALLAMTTFLLMGTVATRYGFVRRQLDKQFEYRVKQKHETDRLRLLKPTGPVRQQQYCDLRDIVTDIEKTDAREARRFELQSLLDHFVTLAVSHQKCLDALRLAGSSDLPRTLPLPDPHRSQRRREIMTRRLRHRDECVRRIEHLADELEAVDELIRLCAQRVACPSLDGDLDREIERRLWEIDEVDAALSQLSA